MRSSWLTKSVTPLKEPAIVSFPLKVENKKFYILLNKDVGSWVVFTEKEWAKYAKWELSEAEKEFLFTRKLAQLKSGKTVNYNNFPKPYDWPSVIILNVTTRCNLACRYCFANCTEKGQDMTKEVIKRAVEQTFDLPLKKFVFEFQGGEPLLNFEAIKYCVAFAKQVCPKDKEVKFRIETNGTLLTEEIAQFLKENNFEVGVSLDGPAELHDGARIYSDGRGSFADAFKGVSILKKYFGAQLNMMGSICVIGPHNISQPKRIVNFFKENGLSFKPLPVNPLGRGEGFKITPQAWFNCFKELYLESKKAGVTNFYVNIYEENIFTPLRDYVCLRSPCGMAHEILSVNPNGDVYPCDGFKGVKEFLLGNIMRENLKQILTKPFTQKLKSRTWRDIKQCAACPFHAMCGSCAYACYGAFNNIYREDPLCAGRKQTFLFIIKEWIKANMLK
jgi:uncharacterized protein